MGLLVNRLCDRKKVKNCINQYKYNDDLIDSDEDDKPITELQEELLEEIIEVEASMEQLKRQQAANNK